MNHTSLFARRMILALGVILFAACTPAAPAATSVPPTATPVPPTATPVPPTATPAQGDQLSPSPRAEVSIAYNTKTNQVILFGGSTGNTQKTSSYNNETWIYDVAANTWTQMKPPSAPSPRGSAGLDYDAESDRIILFAGLTPDNFEMNDTWSFDMNNNSWTQMKPGGPVNHVGCSLVYDSKADRMILFGGFNFKDNLATNDAWAYDYNTDTWTEMKPAASPPGRNWQAMAYDPKADRVIMWGGWGTTNADNDTSLWVYDYNTDTWEERKPSGGPSSRAFHSLSYDPKADRTILYGGYTGGIPTESMDYTINSSETWAYDYNLNTWTLLNPTENPGPLMRVGQVYLSSTDRLLLFGGRSDVDICSDKTWLYDYNANTWTEVTPKQ